MYTLSRTLTYLYNSTSYWEVLTFYWNENCPKLMLSMITGVLRLHMSFTAELRLHMTFTAELRLHMTFTDKLRLHMTFTDKLRLHMSFSFQPRLLIRFSAELSLWLTAEGGCIVYILTNTNTAAPSRASFPINYIITNTHVVIKLHKGRIFKFSYTSTGR